VKFLKVLIQVLAPLKQYVDDNKETLVEGSSVGEAINVLCAKYPKFKEQLFGSSNNIRDFINVFLNGNDIRNKNGLQTKLSENDRIIVMPAIAGGRADSLGS